MLSMKNCCINQTTPRISRHFIPAKLAYLHCSTKIQITRKRNVIFKNQIHGCSCNIIGYLNPEYERNRFFKSWHGMFDFCRHRLLTRSHDCY